MKNISAILLAGGRGTRLQSLTHNKSKSYVSFLGKFRIIDFPLSSLSYSGIKSVGIITQYEPYRLMKYIGNGSSWDLDSFEEGISFLTPFESVNNEITIQKGTANAVLSQIEFIKHSKDEYFLILYGDQIYKIDFRNVLNEHIKNNACLTVLSTTIDTIEEAKRFGVIEKDENDRIINFEEKPDNPKTNNISLGIYLFNKETLLKYLPLANELVDFGKDLIPYILKRENNVFTYTHKGLFVDVGTIESLYDANMYFLDNPKVMDNKGLDFKIYSKPSIDAPIYISKEGKVINSILSDGVSIKGTIKHSLISLNVSVGDKSYIEDSIVMPDAKIGNNVRLKNAIVDEMKEIEDNTVLEFDKPTVVN